MSEDKVKVILGNEYDATLRDALHGVLIDNGAVELNKDWGVGGSQEVETMNVKLRDGLLTVESETYIGLSITGHKLLVDQIAKQVQRKLGNF